jgi:hypothetical protein
VSKQGGRAEGGDEEEGAMNCIQNMTTKKRERKTVSVTSTLMHNDESFFLCGSIGIPSPSRLVLPLVAPHAPADTPHHLPGRFQ